MLVGLSLASNDDRDPVSADFHEFSDVSQPQAFAGRFRREPLGGSSRRTGLTISEIMYNPVGGENGSAGTAFVEIYNSQEVFEEIGGYRLSGDVDYQFPEGTLLEGGAFVVVAANPEAIKAERPLVQVHGPFEGELSRARGPCAFGTVSAPCCWKQSTKTRLLGRSPPMGRGIRLFWRNPPMGRGIRERGRQ